MGVTFQGDWDGIHKINKRLSRHENLIRERISSYGADLFLAAVKELIQNNGEGQKWQITTKWVAKKLKLNEGEKIYIATGKFVSKLRKEKLPNGAYAAGAFANDQYDKHLSMAQLAFYLEYGTRDMPAKPLFRPALQKVQDPTTKKALDELKDVVTGKGPYSG